MKLVLMLISCVVISTHATPANNRGGSGNGGGYSNMVRMMMMNGYGSQPSPAPVPSPEPIKQYYGQMNNPAPAPVNGYGSAPSPSPVTGYGSAPSPSPVTGYGPAPSPSQVPAPTMMMRGYTAANGQMSYGSAPSPSPMMSYGTAPSPSPSPMMSYGSAFSPSSSPMMSYGSSPSSSPMISYGSAPAPSPNLGGGSECNDGDLRAVASNEDVYEVCVHGNWMELPCAPGTWFDASVLMCINGEETSNGGNGGASYGNQGGNNNGGGMTYGGMSNGGMSYGNGGMMKGSGMTNGGTTRGNNNNRVTKAGYASTINNMIMMAGLSNGKPTCDIGTTLALGDDSARYLECVFDTSGGTVMVMRECAFGSLFNQRTNNCGEHDPSFVPPPSTNNGGNKGYGSNGGMINGGNGGYGSNGGMTNGYGNGAGMNNGGGMNKGNTGNSNGVGSNGGGYGSSSGASSSGGYGSTMTPAMAKRIMTQIMSAGAKMRNGQGENMRIMTPSGKTILLTLSVKGHK